ncbi:hypothetical protein D3C86_1949360 [compost metagenome]
MISKDIVPPSSRPANNPVLSNSQEMPPVSPLPIITPSGPTAISVKGTITSSVTVGTIISFRDA